jgi:hypothetical protein
VSRLVTPAVALGLFALAVAAGRAEVPGSVTIVGSAEVKLTGGASRGSARVVFAAATEPTALRLEVVRAGSVGAVVYCDAERLRILVPGPRPLLHETQPTREAFDQTLGLPFCLDELLFALRVGHAPAPACEGRTAVPVTGRRGRVSGLRREGQRGGRPELLRFSRWHAGPNGDWPARAVLETEGSVATLLFGALRPHATAPLDLEPRLVENSRRVGVSSLRLALGLEVTTP